MYRFISKKSDGEINTRVFTTVSEAYKYCVPDDKRHWHIMMYHAVKERLDKGDPLVLVSYDDYEVDVANGIYTAYYIQNMTEGNNTTLPELPVPPMK